MLIVAAFMFVIACKDDDPALSASEQQIKALTGTWIVDQADGVKLDGNPQEAWRGFTLNIAGNGYATSNSTNNTVWPITGSWTFQNDDPQTIRRDDGVTLKVNTTSNTLELSFTIAEETGRTQSINGQYHFTLIKQ